MDIIIFAVIALAIFYKLNKQLGKIDEEEKRSLEERASVMKKMQDELAKNSANQQSQSNTNHSNSPVNFEQKLVGQSSTNQELESLDDATKKNLEEIFTRTNISYDFFVNGAKSAFEIILKAFVDHDLETLRNLLSEKIFSGFEKVINQRNVDQHKLTTNLIAIEKTQIISAITIENQASIVVKFVSKQINYITDKDQNIVIGKKDEIHEITDVWTFKKDLTSPNPNWTVNATSG